MKCAPNSLLDKIFPGRSVKTTRTTTEPPIIKSNETEFGRCDMDNAVHQLIYIDDTRLESNDAQLSGVIEVHLQSPYSITCVKLIDQTMNPALNRTGAEVLGVAEGGQGHKFIKINVRGEYGQGLHFKIYVWGELDENVDENNVK